MTAAWPAIGTLFARVHLVIDVPPHGGYDQSRCCRSLAGSDSGPRQLRLLRPYVSERLFRPKRTTYFGTACDCSTTESDWTEPDPGGGVSPIARGRGPAAPSRRAGRAAPRPPATTTS